MNSKIATIAVMAGLAFGASNAHADLAAAITTPPADGPSSTNTSAFFVNNTRLAAPIVDLANVFGPGLLARFNAATSTITFGVRFDPDQHAHNKDFILWMGPQVNVGGYTATLTQIEVRDGDADSQAFNFSTVLVSSAAGSGENVPNRVYLRDADSLGATVGTPELGEYTEVYFTISVTGAAVGDELSVDYVTNPEPGTLALFGLGLVGLGGVVVRRRRKLAAAQDAAESDA